MKLDFCKSNYREMKRMMKNIIKYNSDYGYLPVVTIGHSKDFLNKKDFIDFLNLLRNEYAENVEIVPLSVAVDKYLDSLSN